MAWRNFKNSVAVMVVAIHGRLTQLAGQQKVLAQPGAQAVHDKDERKNEEERCGRTTIMRGIDSGR